MGRSPSCISLARLEGILCRAFGCPHIFTSKGARCGRSLLLLTLEKQVQLEDSPWIAAVEPFRSHKTSSQSVAQQTLTEIVVLVLRAFPYAILPNKLVQELRMLAEQAQLTIPLVDELAADIFLGNLSNTFLSSAQQAASLLKGSLYECYYAIDYAVIQQDFQPELSPSAVGKPSKVSTQFTNLCARRAGVSLAGSSTAARGTIVEQQQIITTQNLAALFVGLPLADLLHSHLRSMVERCFRWICKRQQMKVDDWHARLIAIKNTAYAWRQMIFFLSFMPAEERESCLQWISDYFEEQDRSFVSRFRPAVSGLMLAGEFCGREDALGDGDLFESDRARECNAERFLGWSSKRHWLMVSKMRMRENDASVWSSMRRWLASEE